MPPAKTQQFDRQLHFHTFEGRCFKDLKADTVARCESIMR